MWTISGLYFSWTNLDEIHGDQFKNLNYQPIAFDSLISPSSINHYEAINKIAIFIVMTPAAGDGEFSEN